MTDSARICMPYLLCSLCAGMTALLLAAPACPLSPDLRIAQFYHTAWTAKEGAPTDIGDLAQTRDGYLWIAGSAGLFRFDGVRFGRIDAIRGRPLLSRFVRSLWAPPEGGLWIGYTFGGVSFISNGSLTNYGEPEGLPVGTVRGFGQDKSGTVWVATSRGLRRFDGSQWIDVSTELQLPKTYVSTLSFDRSGTLWVAVDNSIMYLHPGQRALASTDIRVSGEIQFVEGRDGILWLNDTHQGIRALYVPSDPANASKDWIRLADPGSGPIYTRFIDREGTLWMSTPAGLRRLRDPASLLRHGLAAGASADLLSPTDGLTSIGSSSGLEDREGNVWIGTLGGLDKFREQRLTRIDLPNATDPLALIIGVALAAGDAGAMMVGEYSKTGAFKITKGSTVEAVPGPREINCAHRDPDGIIWFGGAEQIWHSAGERWVAIDLPVRNFATQGYSGVQAMTKDRLGVLWVSIVRAGVFRLADGKWSRYGEPAVSLTTDSDGRVWLGYPNSQVQIVDKDTVRRLSVTDGLNVRVSAHDDLELAFSQIPQDLAADEKIEFRLIVEGTPRLLRPRIRDEVYRIGREALANAFRHSGASVVETVLDYARDRFRIVVRDNGCGMDPEVLRSGREGHWGLSGMHERSNKIGACLNVRSADAAGTEIDLTVPASAAFESSASGSFMDWLARLYSRGEKE
jgi:ligand-binding sensor domain-containing protein